MSHGDVAISNFRSGRWLTLNQQIPVFCQFSFIHLQVQETGQEGDAEVATIIPINPASNNNTFRL